MIGQEPLLNFVGGHWEEAAGAQTIPVRNPATGEVLAAAPLSTATDVAKAVKAALARLPRFEFVGAGTGRGGSEVQAVATTPVLPLKHDVNVRIRREGAKTKVTVRSKSRMGTMDFGQNARNVRELMAALDREMGGL